MADPEIPEVRAEMQRGAPPRRQGLGAIGGLLIGFVAAVIGVIAFAYFV